MNSQLTLLIIYPHWHPANLAGVHRPRLIGSFLEEFGWSPRVLTVEEKYFEEEPDHDFERTFSPDFKVSRVKAFRLTTPRIIGDIGLRAFLQIRKKAIRICREEKIDFIWIPIPSFYMALMGPILLRKTGIPYGIDYIDPWVRDISNRKTLRAITSQWMARILEPVAVKKASLITGVSEGYYMPVLKRNRLLSRKPLPVIHAAFPYGFDPEDHRIPIKDIRYPWGEGDKKVWLYAGAFLPNSHLFIDLLFKVISELKRNAALETETDFQLYFIGTGHYTYKSVQQYAADHGIEDMVVEIRERFPYLHTLNFLSAVDTVMIIGSTEQHYTASKTYQALLSGTPVLSVFHRLSQASQVMSECNADLFTVKYDTGMPDTDLEEEIRKVVISRLWNNDWDPQLKNLQPYSAQAGAQKLVECISDCL